MIENLKARDRINNEISAEVFVSKGLLIIMILKNILFLTSLLI